MMGFGGIGMLVFWGGILALLAGGGALFLRQWTGSKPGDEGHKMTARQLLDERFAKGELDSDEYRAIRAQIER